MKSIQVEVWEDIKDYEGLYKVSNYGNIKSLSKYAGKSPRKEKLLKVHIDRYGYPYVVLCKEGKEHLATIHRLVAEAFIPNPHNKPQINHIDENKLNYQVSNLEWCTCKYNINYGTRTIRASMKRRGNFIE